MNIKFEDKEYSKVSALLAGFMTEDQKELTFNMVASPNLEFNVAMQLIQSLTVNLLHAYSNQHPEAKEDLYDAYNIMASSILNNLIPDKELRMDLDAEAILKAEAELIESKYAAMSKKEKSEALKNIDRIRNNLKNGDKKVQ